MTFPGERWRHTRYVFWMLESPANMHRTVRTFAGVFNWTFTYRLDSDFPMPYGRVYRRRVPLKETSRNYAAGKTKMAAWFVSHCDAISGREQLVATLRRWVEVDQYGRCGGLSCSLHQSDKCDLLLNTHYKFYLSFENSLCRDYVTEKFFRILRLDIVPVVFGQANYGLHAPPHAYIDALTFPSVKALADHLIYLDKNDTAYNEYFRWKRYHRVPNSWENWSKPYCELCERLHADHTVKVYHDIHQWFVEGSSCRTRFNHHIAAFINGQ
nr:alpha-(1,3)-fucosyltransferase C-like [Procambarus clarkii]